MCTNDNQQNMLVTHSISDLLTLPANSTAIRLYNANDEALRVLARFENLQILNIAGSLRVTDHGLASLRDLTLRILNLGYCEEITDDGLACVAAIASLEDLDLTFCGLLTSRGVSRLALLPRLRRLNLDTCYSVDDDAAYALAASTTLEELWCDECKFTDDGILCISRIPNLRMLGLPSFADISDRAIEYLADNARRLESLIMANLDITDIGLAALSRLGTLKRLLLRNNRHVTLAGVASLRQALPHLQISERWEPCSC